MGYTIYFSVLGLQREFATDLIIIILYVVMLLFIINKFYLFSVALTIFILNLILLGRPEQIFLNLINFIFMSYIIYKNKIELNKCKIRRINKSRLTEFRSSQIEQKCSICQDFLHLESIKMLLCGHSYHNKCILLHIELCKNKEIYCPICREIIPK